MTNHIDILFKVFEGIIQFGHLCPPLPTTKFLCLSSFVMWSFHITFLSVMEFICLQTRGSLTDTFCFSWGRIIASYFEEYCSFSYLWCKMGEIFNFHVKIFPIIPSFIKQIFTAFELLPVCSELVKYETKILHWLNPTKEELIQKESIIMLYLMLSRLKFSAWFAMCYSLVGYRFMFLKEE